MSGRHRRAGVPTARRALAASVPALGVVGAVAALTGDEPAAAPSADAAGSVTPVADSTGPLAPAATVRPAVAGVATDAARAAGQAQQRQQEQERAALADVVSDVRADAQDRQAAAKAQGQEQLDAFRRDVERLQAPDPSAPEGRADRCDTSGIPLFGDRADSDEIVGRDCGLVDMTGRERSFDPWIDGQLLSRNDE